MAVHVRETPSALATRTLVVTESSEPLSAEARTLSGFTTSRSAVAGLMSLSRRHVVTDTASAKTKAVGMAGARRMSPKSRLIGYLRYKVNWLESSAPAHAVAVAQRAVCFGLAAPVSFAAQSMS